MTTLDPRLWDIRAAGADLVWAQEVARRIGPRAVILQTGEYAYSVYKPRFEEIVTDNGTKFDLVQVDGEWMIGMSIGTITYHLSRQDIAQLMSHALPEAAALLDTLRHIPAHARMKSHNKRPSRHTGG